MEIKNKWVIIGNRGHGVQKLYPESLKPATYNTELDALEVIEKLSIMPEQFLGNYMGLIHWHTTKVADAHKFVSIGNKAWDGLQTLHVHL